MSDKSTENYLDNLLDSMNKLQDTDTKMSGADQDEFLKKFEDELENETYDEYLSNFEKELERENEQAKGQALNVQTPAPDDKDASLDDMLTEFDRRMKEQETQGDKQENKADDNLSDAVFNFTPADSGKEMMDANMPEMAENPKQEETPESIITNEPQMVEEIGEPDLAGNASKDVLDILDSDGLDNIGDLLEGKTGETGNDIDDYASRQMKAHETTDGELDAQGTEKKSLFKKIISFFTKEPQSDDVTDTQGMADGTETDAQMLSDENNQEEELKTQATPNECDEETVGQETSQENEAPLTEEEKLAQELEKANEQIEEQKDKYLRLSAEFDNYRKRTMKEKAELILNGGEKSISSILPIVDDFERALKNMETATDVAAVKEGVELIYNKFMSVLGQNGVKVIETKEQPLDTDYHEAIAVIPAPNEALKGKILDCVQTGYILNDKVIRHAKVVVGE